jgi:hypothetical protein
MKIRSLENQFIYPMPQSGSKLILAAPSSSPDFLGIVGSSLPMGPG